MIQVFVAKDATEAHWVRGLLEAEGIPAEVRGESLRAAFEGGLFVPGIRPSVWLLDEGQYYQAKGVVFRFLHGLVEVEGQPWICPRCGEHLEPQFTDCWRCEMPRPDGSGG